MRHHPCNASSPFKPLHHLRDLLKQQNIELEERKTSLPLKSRPLQKVVPGRASSEEEDLQLFREAMQGVVPMKRCNTTPHGPRKPQTHKKLNPDKEALCQLKSLITNGIGFKVSLMPEYIEGISIDAHPETAQKLRNGEYTIQDYIDLHGCSVIEARDALDYFLKKAILYGKRSVLIVHGRGLSSPRRPVLKTKLIAWLTSGKWKKWVLAFTSARRCDGGSGASYVLLRNRPLSKRLWKQNRIRSVS